MKYTGQIQECKVLYDNPFDLWHPMFLVTARQQTEQCLMSLPHVPTREAFLKGMMSLTRGSINPTLVLEVYDNVVSDVVFDTELEYIVLDNIKGLYDE